MLISLIVVLVVVGLLWWALETVLGVLPLPQPIATVVRVLLIVVLVLIVVFYVLLPVLHMIPTAVHR